MYSRGTLPKRCSAPFHSTFRTFPKWYSMSIEKKFNTKRILGIMKSLPSSSLLQQHEHQHHQHHSSSHLRNVHGKLVGSLEGSYGKQKGSKLIGFSGKVRGSYYGKLEKREYGTHRNYQSLSNLDDKYETNDIIYTVYTLKEQYGDDWWTGKNPSHDEIPGMLPNSTITSLALPHLGKCTRKQVLDYFDNSWTLTEVLFSSLQTEKAFTTIPYHHLRHPLIFYYGHTAVFYVNKLLVAGVLEKGVNPYFERVFEVGVDEMKWDDMTKNTMEWPTLHDLIQYRRQVYQLVKDIILQHPQLETGHPTITKNCKLWALFMAFEHERIHLETSSVLMRELPLHHLKKPQHWMDSFSSTTTERNLDDDHLRFPKSGIEKTPDDDHLRFPKSGIEKNPDDDHLRFPKSGIDYPENEWISHPGGDVTLGKSENFPTFGWDNEYGTRHLTIAPFKGTKHLITNGEFFEFVVQSGYQESKYWSKEGWEWKSFRNAKFPTFWCQIGPSVQHQYAYRTIFNQIEMPWDWPVDVNYHEAAAYAAWRTEKDGSDIPYHLTTEGIHQLIRDDYNNQDPIMNFKKGKMMDTFSMNLNLSYGSSTPVNLLEPTEHGFHDVFGNTWEWCEDHFSALEGFQVHRFYDDFSTPCFDGEHNSIVGGSFMSSGDNGGSIYSRYHFRPHFHQHAGFRLFQPLQPQEHIQTVCLDAPGPYAKPNPYRTSKSFNKKHSLSDANDLVLQQLISQYKLPQSIGLGNNLSSNIPNFQKACAKITAAACEKHAENMSFRRVLDLGCAIGGTSFALSTSFDEILGIDNNPRYIQLANDLKEKGHLQFQLNEESTHEFHVENTKEMDRSRVSFKLGDAMSLVPSLQNFTAVLLANLLENVVSPASVLKRMGGHGGVVAPGGILVIGSTYEWDENITPLGSRINGIVSSDGKSMDYVTPLSECLGEEFEFLNQQDIPYWNYLNQRSYKVQLSNVTVWKRKFLKK